MSHTTTIDYSTENSTEQRISLENTGQTHVDLPDASYVTNADIVRDGVDLILKTPDGTVVVEGYFAAEPAPQLVAPDGTSLTPALVNSFAHGVQEYASAMQTTNDASPIGAVQEISGEAHVTRVNGTVEIIGVGTPIYQGDVVETDEDGAVNIMFIDETTFAVSEDARLAIDEYVFDPATQSGTTNFSVLKGVFVFTSGLIGREDPDDVTIETPSGSIGIRGTIIAGNVTTGEITVIEGAIVLSDLSGNTITLSNQFETARFNASEGSIDHIGELAANDISTKYSTISGVAADLFSSIEEAAKEEMEGGSEGEGEGSEEPAGSEEKAAEAEEEAPQDQAEGEGEGESGDGAKAEPAKEGEVEGENPVEPAKEEIKTEESPPEGKEIITSDDITGSSAEDSSDGGDEPVAAKPPPPAEDKPAPTTSEPTPEPLVNTAEEKPPINISVERFAVNENVASANLAKITGEFTQYTELSLVGTSSNYYELDRIDDNNFIVKLKSGEALDAESPHKLAVIATNQTGSESIIKTIDLNIQNLEEGIDFEAPPPALFQGTDDSVLRYDMSQNFHDNDGQAITYSVASLSHPELATAITITPGGILNIELIDNVTIGGSFAFDVTATTADGSSRTELFSYELYDTTDDPDSVDGTSFLTTPDYRYNTTDANFSIADDGLFIYADSNNAPNTVNVNGLNAFVKTGGGNDIFNTNWASGFTLFGEEGNDIFSITSGRGKVYGGTGNDKFIVEDGIAYTNLRDYDGSINEMDGGAGYDTVKFSIAGTIELNLIDSDIIKNIEMINFDNGEINNIELSYDDVVEMTDSNNRLVIQTDDDDVAFNNTSGRDFFQLQNQTVGSEEYNVFTDGTVTLLVDTDADVVTGII